MSSVPWFKFYPGDYLADTQRLTQRQHGAYMLIMLDYYSTGEAPPDDDSVLMRVTLSNTLSDWEAIRLAIRRFFEIRDGKWYHTRIERELKKRMADRQAKQGAAFRTNRVLGRNTLSDTLTETHARARTRYQIPEARDQKPKPEPRDQTASQEEMPGTSKSIRASRLPDGMKILTDLGVDEQIAKDWLTVRKAKRAPLTQTAINTLKNEAGKAGITVAEAVAICAQRSWQGFKASWDWRGIGNGTRTSGNAAALAQAKRELFGDKAEKDITDESKRV